MTTIIELIENQKTIKLAKIINEIHVADLAEIIEQLSNKNAKYIYNLITNEENAAAVLIELEDDTREKLLRNLTAKEIAAEVIENLATDDAADVIGELSETKIVLSHIENVEHASDISDLLKLR